MLKKSKENSIFKGSKYEVMLPFRPHFDFILDNYILAEKSLKSLQEHLTEDSNLLFEYDKTMNDYMILGIIQKLPLDENVEPAVVKSERETTKVRVVFDVSREQPDKLQLSNKRFYKWKLISLAEVFYNFSGGNCNTR